MAHSLEAVSLEKLKSFLECSICLDTLTNPRTLPCFHSYCQPCLENFVKKQRGKGNARCPVTKFNCPLCRSQFTLNAEENVADVMLANHFILSMLEVMATDQHRVKGVPCSHCQMSSVGRCIDCNVFLCQDCLADHNKYQGFADHSTLSMEELSKPENQVKGNLHCQRHENKKMKFYCETCQELICRYCMDFDHEKPAHSCLPIGNVAGKEKQRLVASCGVLLKKLSDGTEAVGKIVDSKESLEEAKEKAKCDIIRRKDEILEEVTQKLNKKADDLMEKYDALYIAEQSCMIREENESEASVENLRSYLNLFQELLDRGTDEEILSTAKSVNQTIEKFQKERFPQRATNSGNIMNYEYVSIDHAKLDACVEQMGSIRKKHEVSGVISHPIFANTRIPWDSDTSDVVTGNQPPGEMTFSKQPFHLPGFQCARTIVIKYSIPDGVQGPNHPKPGQWFTGKTCLAYLPDNKEGKKILQLLRRAFDQRLTFTIRRSFGVAGGYGVIWNYINHKTNKYGGPSKFGYPDPDYLRKVREDLAAKGITGW